MGKTQFDAVVIGRNEGDRLARALERVIPYARHVAYVDSGSLDDSVARARATGVKVVELDPARPFTAARARNEGFAALATDRAEFVHFIDGDSILDVDWLHSGVLFLEQHPKAALVHGYNVEEAPDASVYNWLTNQEWQKQTGPDASGVGTFLARSTAFAQVGGFRADMIAAEDDELFFRLRKAGWQTWCVPEAMAAHDVRLHTFMPWFRRMIRAGHSFAELGILHEGAARMSRLRAVVWAGVLPVVGALGLWVWWPLGLLVMALYGMSAVRLWRRCLLQGLPSRPAAKAAGLLVIAKFAHLYGMATYWIGRFRRSDAKIIEYK